MQLAAVLLRSNRADLCHPEFFCAASPQHDGKMMAGVRRRKGKWKGAISGYPLEDQIDEEGSHLGAAMIGSESLPESKYSANNPRDHELLTGFDPLEPP